MPIRYFTGKAFEMIGMTVVAAALFAGLGIVDGNPSMGKELTLLGIGGLFFTLGWLIERGTQK